MMFEFIFNGHEYRTNPDATWVEYRLTPNSRWIRTKYLTVRLAAVNHLKSIGVL